MQKNGAESFGIYPVPTATVLLLIGSWAQSKDTGNTVAFVTAHSSITGGRKLLFPTHYFQHTPKTLEFHRQRFVVCLWRVLKIPKQSIFFPPSIPLSLQPLFQAVIQIKIFGGWACRTPPFFCDSVSPFCQRFSKFLQYIAVIHFTDSEEPFFSAVYTLPSPHTPVCRPSKYSVRHTGVFSISFHRFDNNSIEDQAPRKNKKKESKVLLSGKCADNIKP